MRLRSPAWRKGHQGVTGQAAQGQQQPHAQGEAWWLLQGSASVCDVRWVWKPRSGGPLPSLSPAWHQDGVTRGS